MIEVKNLWKTFGGFVALRGISFTVERGTIAGFLGPNGAGKSTTMRILTTFLAPAAGEARIAGHEVTKEPGAVCAKLGYLPEQMSIYPEMRVREYLRFRGTLRGLRGKGLQARVDRVLEDCSLRDMQGTLLASLSRGYRQRVGLADSMLHEPPVLILDEPSAGLDPLQVIEIRKLLDRMRGERTILFSTHILSEVEQICDQVIILHRGEIQASESRGGWQQRLRASGRVRLLLNGRPHGAGARLRELAGVREVTGDGTDFQLRTDRDLRLEIHRLAVASGWEVLELRSMEATLEELFVEVTAQPKASRP